MAVPYDMEKEQLYLQFR